MQNRYTTIKLILTTVLSLSGTVSLFSQECQNVFLLKPKSRIEIAGYKGDHTPLGSTVVNYVDTTYTDDAGKKIAIVHSLHYTDKGEMNSDTRLIYICDGKTVNIAYDNEALAAKMYDDMKAIAEKHGGKTFAYTSVNDELEYPTELKEGMELKEYGVTTAMTTKVDEKEWKSVGLPKISANYNSNGVRESNTVTTTYVEQIVEKDLATGSHMLFTNIKVGAKEKITVPAGTFDCFKVTKELYVQAYGSKKRSKGHDWIRDVKKEVTTPSQEITEWYAPGIGSVRSEIKGPKGNVIIIMEATKITQ